MPCVEFCAIIENPMKSNSIVSRVTFFIVFQIKQRRKYSKKLKITNKMVKKYTEKGYFLNKTKFYLFNFSDSMITEAAFSEAPALPRRSCKSS